MGKCPYGNKNGRRTIQKCLLSLEKFCCFIVYERSPQLPKLAQASLKWHKRFIINATTGGGVQTESLQRGGGRSLTTIFNTWRRYARKVCEEELTHLTKTSSDFAIQRPLAHNPWDRQDEKLLLRFFAFKPPKDIIRRVCEEVDELQELVARKGFDRVYEKVKTMYKRARALIG